VLTDHGIDATVWDARCVAPIDGRMLDDAARHHVIVTAEDAVIDGGFGARVVAALSERGDPASPRVVTAGVPSTYLPHGKASGILADLGLDGAASHDRRSSASEPGELPGTRCEGGAG